MDGHVYRATRDADSAKAERITIEELRSHVLAGDEFDDLQARVQALAKLGIKSAVPLANIA